MARLTIRLLGPVQIALDGEPVTHFESEKTRALLAYLAAEPGQPHRREVLAEMLWPDRPEGAARANLRHTLAHLRRVIEEYAARPPSLLPTRHTIQFNAGSDAWTDVAAFTTLLPAPLPADQPLDQQTVRQLEEAVELYQGSFLEDISLADSAAFEEWRVLRREHFNRLVLDALWRLAASYEGQGEHDRALAHARQALEIEPWDEAVLQQVMRLLALAGRRAEAVAQYEVCRRRLAEELSVEPAVETTQLYEQIRQGQVGPELAVRTGPPAPVWGLPASPTPFFGRTEELSALVKGLADPDTRLLTATGPGGSGKTRLALEAGRRLAAQDRRALADGSPLMFPHGVVFVPLAAVDAADGLVPALADALQLRLQGGQKQLLRALGRRQILLILDNLEHLLAGVGLLADILRTAPGVHILATSRERLRLQGECVLPVGGLCYPDHDLGPSSPEAADLESCVAAYPAFQLLVESARRVQSNFVITPEDLPVLLDICRQVEGLPLALELAASWADALSLRDILSEARQSLGFLQVEWRDGPARQRSMRAVFDVSWRRLRPEEQAAFSRMSVFRGGFSRDAAAQVVMASPQLLATLVRKSFLQHDQAKARYRVHELLRQYGAEKLALDPTFEVAARDQHSQFYCGWLGQAGEGIKGAVQQTVWDAIQGDVENVRAACLWAARRGPQGRLVQAVDALGWFYYLGYGNYEQGQITLRRLREALVKAETGPTPTAAEAQRTMVRVLAWEGTMWSLLGDLEASWRLIREGRALLDSPALADEDTRLERAHLAHQAGYGRNYADPGTAWQHFSESLQLYQEIGHKLGMAYAHLGVNRAAALLGAHGEAREAVTQSISLHREVGNRIGESEATVRLAWGIAKQLRFQEAEDLMLRALSLTPGTNRFGIAWGLGSLGLVQLLTGRFAEAEATILDCIAISEDLGWQVWVIRRSIVLARARLHMGAYHTALRVAEETVSLARQVGWSRGISHGKLVLGEVALAKADYAQAHRILQESLLGLKELTEEPADVNPAAWLGLAARGLERRPEAWQCLVSALEWASKFRGVPELMVTLAGIALLLADEGQTERAIELYALVSSQPFVANSRWFEDVAGQQLTPMAANLPKAVVTAARERGRARDLDATVGELLAEFRT
jgi:DNA-binding SARP family transcriptional activator/predicted ATPase